MSDIWKILLTSVATIIGGLFLFGCTKWAELLSFGPAAEERKVRADVIGWLYFFADVYANPLLPNDDDPDRRAKYHPAKVEIRHLPRRLITANQSVAFGRKFIPVLSETQLRDVVRHLTGISNGLFSLENHYDRQQIKQNCDSADAIRSILGAPRI